MQKLPGPKIMNDVPENLKKQLMIFKNTLDKEARKFTEQHLQNYRNMQQKIQQEDHAKMQSNMLIQHLDKLQSNNFAYSETLEWQEEQALSSSDESVIHDIFLKYYKYRKH